MNREGVLELATGWHAPNDDGAHERYRHELSRFAERANQGEFKAFLVELRRQARAGQSDYTLTVYPAVRLYLRRFGTTPGRVLVGYLEAAHAGELEAEEEFLALMAGLSPDDRVARWLQILHHPLGDFEPDQRVRWEMKQLELLRERWPTDPLVEKALETVRSSQEPLFSRANQDVWNRIFRSVWEEYDRRFPELL